MSLSPSGSPRLGPRASRSSRSSRSFVPSGTETLQERYKVSYSHKLGEGSFARVYKGLDTIENKVVAVKVFKYVPDSGEFAQMHENFSQLVAAMLTLAGAKTDLDSAVARDAHDDDMSLGMGLAGKGRMTSKCSFNPNLIEDDAAIFHGTHDKAKEIVSSMDLKSCFVQLMGYSMDASGRPGLDIDSEKFFVVTECGEESLSDNLARHADAGTTLTVDQLRSLQWSLVSIVCGLHAAGFVHLDIKPCNVLQFGEVWKLIDFDGAVRTQSTVDQERCFVTPWYLAPEIARNKTRHVTVSRLMDVWSVGMCALEAVFLQPVLRPWYEEWRASTGGDDKFFAWLGDYDTAPIMGGEMREAMADIDTDMSELLQGMLAKDPRNRLCIAECLVHPWFDRIRSRMWLDMGGHVSNPGAQVLSPASIDHVPKPRGCPELIITPRNGVPGVIFGESNSNPVVGYSSDHGDMSGSESSSLMARLQTVGSCQSRYIPASEPSQRHVWFSQREKSRMCLVM